MKKKIFIALISIVLIATLGIISATDTNNIDTNTITKQTPTIQTQTDTTPNKIQNKNITKKTQKNTKQATTTEVNNYDELINEINTAKTSNTDEHIINLKTGDYNATGNIVWGNTVGTTRTLTINGNNITLDGNGKYQFMEILKEHNLNLKNIRLLNFNAQRGGAIQNKGTLIITNSTLNNNTAGEYGGAIHNEEYGTVTITQSTLENNTAKNGGGAIQNKETLIITNSTLNNNTAKNGGGAIYSTGTLTITQSTLNNNNANGSGGTIDNAGKIIITNTTLNNNNANESGGTIVNSGKIIITNSTLNNNTAGEYGGAIHNDEYGTVTLTQSTLNNNTAGEYGGAIHNKNILMIYYSNFINNSDKTIYSETEYTFINSTIYNETINNENETSTIKELEEKIKNLTQTIEELQNKNNQLEQENNQKQTTIDTLNNTNQQLENTNKNLNNTVNTQKQTINDLENNLNIANNKTTQQEKQIQELNTTLNNANNQINNLNNNIKDMNKKIQELTEEKSALNKTNNILENTITNLNTLINNQKQTINDLENNLNIANNKTTQQEKQIQELNTALSTAETSLQNNNNLIKELNQIITTLNNQIKQLTTPINTKVTINTMNTAKYGENTTITGTLKDNDGNTIRYGILNVTVNKDSILIGTDNKGVYTYTITPNTMDNNIVTVTSITTDKYTTSSAKTTFNVIKATPTLKINSISAVKYKDSVVVSGSLVDSNKKAVNGASLNIQINSKTVNVKTDNDGLFTYKTTTTSMGTNNVTITYAGNSYYNKVSKKTTFKVNKQNLLLIVDHVSNGLKYKDSLVVGGRLVDGNGKAIANSQVSLKFNGKTYKAKTDKNGYYKVTTRATTIDKNNLTVTYAGNKYYNKVTAKTTFTVAKQDLVITFNTVKYSNGKVTISGTFTDRNRHALMNSLARITLNGKQGTAKTDKTGTVTYTTKASKGTYKVTLAYPGNARYNAYSKTSTVKTA